MIVCVFRLIVIIFCGLGCGWKESGCVAGLGDVGIGWFGLRIRF